MAPPKHSMEEALALQCRSSSSVARPRPSTSGSQTERSVLSSFPKTLCRYPSLDRFGSASSSAATLDPVPARGRAARCSALAQEEALLLRQRQQRLAEIRALLNRPRENERLRLQRRLLAQQETPSKHQQRRQGMGQLSELQQHRPRQGKLKQPQQQQGKSTLHHQSLIQQPQESSFLRLGELETRNVGAISLLRPRGFAAPLPVHFEEDELEEELFGEDEEDEESLAGHEPATSASSQNAWMGSGRTRADVLLGTLRKFPSVGGQRSKWMSDVAPRGSMSPPGRVDQSPTSQCLPGFQSRLVVQGPPKGQEQAQAEKREQGYGQGERKGEKPVRGSWQGSDPVLGLFPQLRSATAAMLSPGRERVRLGQSVEVRKGEINLGRGKKSTMVGAKTTHINPEHPRQRAALALSLTEVVTGKSPKGVSTFNPKLFDSVDDRGRTVSVLAPVVGRAWRGGSSATALRQPVERSKTVQELPGSFQGDMPFAVEDPGPRRTRGTHSSVVYPKQGRWKDGLVRGKQWTEREVEWNLRVEEEERRLQREARGEGESEEESGSEGEESEGRDGEDAVRDVVVCGEGKGSVSAVVQARTASAAQGSKASTGLGKQLAIPSPSGPVPQACSRNRKSLAGMPLSPAQHQQDESDSGSSSSHFMGRHGRHGSVNLSSTGSSRCGAHECENLSDAQHLKGFIGKDCGNGEGVRGPSGIKAMGIGPAQGRRVEDSSGLFRVASIRGYFPSGGHAASPSSDPTDWHVEPLVQVHADYDEMFSKARLQKTQGGRARILAYGGLPEDNKTPVQVFQMYNIDGQTRSQKRPSLVSSLLMSASTKAAAASTATASAASTTAQRLLQSLSNHGRGHEQRSSGSEHRSSVSRTGMFETQRQGAQKQRGSGARVTSPHGAPGALSRIQSSRSSHSQKAGKNQESKRKSHGVPRECPQPPVRKGQRQARQGAQFSANAENCAGKASKASVANGRCTQTAAAEHKREQAREQARCLDDFPKGREGIEGHVLDVGLKSFSAGEDSNSTEPLKSVNSELNTSSDASSPGSPSTWNRVREWPFIQNGPGVGAAQRMVPHAGSAKQ